MVEELFQNIAEEVGSKMILTLLKGSKTVFTIYGIDLPKIIEETNKVKNQQVFLIDSIANFDMDEEDEKVIAVYYGR